MKLWEKWPCNTVSYSIIVYYKHICVLACVRNKYFLNGFSGTRLYCDFCNCLNNAIYKMIPVWTELHNGAKKPAGRGGFADIENLTSPTQEQWRKYWFYEKALSTEVIVWFCIWSHPEFVCNQMWCQHIFRLSNFNTESVLKLERWQAFLKHF